MSEHKPGPANTDGADELGRDMELAGVLKVLDPASADPNYWMRFRTWVLEAAAPELARRRLMSEVTVGDVMTSWARTVVPTAVLAAAVAAFLLLRAPAAPAPAPVALGVEELLLAGEEGVTIPSALEESEREAMVAFAGESF